MGIKHLWDTNTTIYFLQNDFTGAANAFIQKSVLENAIAISVITEIELLCWPSATQQEIENIYELLSNLEILELDKDVKTQTISIRKAHRVKLPDALIAATALVHDLTLITRNTKDFTNIEGLKVINPFELEEQ